MNLFWIKIKNSVFDGFRIFFGDIFDFANLLYVRIYLISLAALNVLSWLLARVIENKASREQAVLHYNVDFGVNLIDSVKKIYAIPFLCLSIILINFLLSAVIYKRSEKFISHALLLSAVLANIFLLAGLASLFLINFR